MRKKLISPFKLFIRSIRQPLIVKNPVFLSPLKDTQVYVYTYLEEFLKNEYNSSSDLWMLARYLIIINSTTINNLYTLCSLDFTAKGW
jgi:hypothetical protein